MLTRVKADDCATHSVGVTMLEIDGAYGEGGGQLVRTAVALSAITHRPVRISNIRAGRSRPGLAAQHIAAVRAVAALCEARTAHLDPHSAEIQFDPGAIRGGSYRFEIGTAGSTMLVLQALIPVAVMAGGFCRVVVTGGTDVRGAPPGDYMCHVVLPLLGRMGVEASLDVRRRGYYPQGGGEVEFALTHSALRPLRCERPGGVLRVEGHVHVARLSEEVAERMRAAAHRRLEECGLPAAIGLSVLDQGQAHGPGGAITLWVADGGGILGAARVAERGVRAESLGAAVAEEIAADVRHGAALDRHAADQILVYLALARGESEITVRELTSHARTAMWLIERFLPVRFEVVERAGVFRIRVQGAGVDRSRAP